jgi:hypothetical protein
MPTLDSALPLPSDDSRRASPSVPEQAARWAQLLEALKKSMRREQFDTWFRRVALVRLDDDCLQLAAHNAFARDWLLDYYEQELALAAGHQPNWGNAARRHPKVLGNGMSPSRR